MGTAKTNCVNGELEAGDLVLSSPSDEFGCLVGIVLKINKLGTPEHDEETGNDTDDVHVNFMDAGYTERRISEIGSMLSDLYGERKMLYDSPLDDTIMAPDMLIRITGIARGELEKILDSEAAASAYYRHALLSEPPLAIETEPRNTDIKALIIYDERHSIELPIPYSKEERDALSDFLASAGWWNPTGDVYIDDDPNNDINVRLVGATDFDNKIIALFNNTHTLSDASDACRFLNTLPPEQLKIAGWLTDEVPFRSVDVLMESVKSLTAALGKDLAIAEPGAFDDEAPDALRSELIERINANLSVYFDAQRGLSGEEIAGKSLEIASVATAHYYMTEIHGFRATEVEYLLRFQDPLKVVADEFEWENAVDNRSDVMWSVFQKQEALTSGKHALMPEPAGPDETAAPRTFAGRDVKPSVMEQIRRAAKDAPGKKHTNPEL